MWMGHHPPLYYVLGSLAISWIDSSDFDQMLRPNPHFVWAENDGSNGWNVMLHFGQDAFPWQGAILALHVMRWVSVVLGAVAVLAVYNVTHYLLPKHRWAPLGAASLVAFNPSFVFMSSTVHHDVLLAAIFSLGFWWAVRVVSVPMRMHDLWIGGLLAGAAALTKLSGASLVAVMGLALLLKGWASRSWKKTIKQISLLLGVALIVSGWWFIRNQVLYGDPLGWQMFLSIYHFNVRQTPYTWYLFWNEFIPQLGRTFWGTFGFMHITFPEISRYPWLVTGVAALGLGVAIIRRIRRLRLTPQLFACVVVTAGLALIFTLVARYSFTFAGGGHARYLFPAAPAIGGLLIAGFNGLTNWRHERVVALVLSLGLLGYAIWLPLTLVLPKYTAPEMASAEEIEQALPSDWVFGEAVKLVAYNIEPGLAIPDAWLTLRFYWQATGPAANRPDVYAYARLVNEEGETFHAIDFWPAKSTAPAVWAPDETYVSHQVLHVPAEGHTGKVYVEVTLASGRNGPALPATRDASDGEKASAARLGPIPAVGQVVEVHDDVVRNR